MQNMLGKIYIITGKRMQIKRGIMGDLWVAKKSVLQKKMLYERDPKITNAFK